MDSKEIEKRRLTLDDHMHLTKDGVEFWYARYACYLIAQTKEMDYIKSVIMDFIYDPIRSHMPAIYPSTALKNQQREIKAIADNEIVYITENGRGKYAFMSQDVLQRKIDDAVEQALYEQRMNEALAQSRQDFDQGRCYSSREELLQAIEQKRNAHA